MLCGMVGLLLAAGPVATSAAACSMPVAQDHGCRESRDCCCTHPGQQRGCATMCSTDDYAGVARLSASPFRITRAPLRKPLASLDAFPVLCRAVPAYGYDAAGWLTADARGRPITLPKRYLRLCTLRL